MTKKKDPGPSPKREALRAVATLRGMLGRPLDGLELALANSTADYLADQIAAIHEVQRVRKATAPAEVAP